MCQSITIIDSYLLSFIFITSGLFMVLKFKVSCEMRLCHDSNLCMHVIEYDDENIHCCLSVSRPTTVVKYSGKIHRYFSTCFSICHISSTYTKMPFYLYDPMNIIINCFFLSLFCNKLIPFKFHPLHCNGQITFQFIQKLWANNTNFERIFFFPFNSFLGNKFLHSVEYMRHHTIILNFMFTF